MFNFLGVQSIFSDFVDRPRRKEIGGNIYYYDNDGELHNDDGPAVILECNLDTFQIWMVHGKFHREDGPAQLSSAGSCAYWLNDCRVSKEEFETQRFNLKVPNEQDYYSNVHGV